MGKLEKEFRMLNEMELTYITGGRSSGGPKEYKVKCEVCGWVSDWGTDKQGLMDAHTAATGHTEFSDAGEREPVGPPGTEHI